MYFVSNLPYTIISINSFYFFVFSAIRNSKNEDRNYNVSVDDTENNKMASILKVIAIIEIICGFIVGGILGDTFEIGYDYNWRLCIGIIVASFINGFCRSNTTSSRYKK